MVEMDAHVLAAAHFLEEVLLHNLAVLAAALRLKDPLGHDPARTGRRVGAERTLLETMRSACAACGCAPLFHLREALLEPLDLSPNPRFGLFGVLLVGLRVGPGRLLLCAVVVPQRHGVPRGEVSV